MAPRPACTLSPGRGHPSRPVSRSFMALLISALASESYPQNLGMGLWALSRKSLSAQSFIGAPKFWARCDLGIQLVGTSLTERRLTNRGQPSGRALKKKKAASGRRWMPPIIPDRFREEERTDHNFKLAAMLQPHNRQVMIFLHCSDAQRLNPSQERRAPLLSKPLRVCLRLKGNGPSSLVRRRCNMGGRQA